MEENKTIYKKICKYCGKEFETTNLQKIYCNRKCLADYHNSRKYTEKETYNRTCPICGKSFSTTDNRKTYCSVKCSRKAHKNTEKEERRRIMRAVRKVCPTCGKEFNPNVHNQVFCSKNCLRKAKYKEYKESIKSEYEKICPVCGKHFTSIRKNTVYCSRECQHTRWKMKNENKVKEYKKQYRKENKEYIAKQLKEYCIKHKEELRIKKCEYVKQRTKKDPVFRMKALCRAMVRRCLVNKKLYRSHVILGYTPEDLIKHLESNFYGNMSWQNTNKWEIHHIRPLDTFNFVNEDGSDNYETIREANVLENLIPLFKKDHKKVSTIYFSEKKCLTLEEIQQMIGVPSVNK